MARVTQEQRNESYRRGWKDSLRAYSAMYENQGPSPYDYGQGWHDCARERWRDPARRGAMPDGAPAPNSQAEYRAALATADGPTTPTLETIPTEGGQTWPTS